MGRKWLYRGFLVTAMMLVFLLAVSCAYLPFFKTDLVVHVLHALHNEKDVGDTIAFSLTITGGTLPYTVQWYKGAELVGAGNPLVLNNVQVADSGHYWAVVTDKSIPAKVALSQRAELVVFDGPRFVQGLVNDVVNAGDPYTLEVQITGGTQPYTVAWFFEGNPLPAPPASERVVTRLYNLGIMTPAKEGYYMVRVEDDNGKIAESTAYLTVRSEGSTLAIVQHPASKTVLQGDRVTFEVVTSGGVGQVNYQWTRNGVAIPGATERTYTIEQALETGLEPDEYQVILEDESGVPLVSNIAYLRVLAVPNAAGNWNVAITLTAVKVPYLRYAGNHVVEVEQWGNSFRATGDALGTPIQMNVVLERLNGEWVFSMHGTVMGIYTVELNHGYVQPNTANPDTIWGGFLVRDPTGIAWVGVFNGTLP